MPPSTPPRSDGPAGSWLETKWVTSTKKRFFELTKIALKWPAVSHAYCFAGIEPENLHKVTYGSDSELRNTLHNIYAEHGPVDLQVRGRDEFGNYYLKCSQVRGVIGAFVPGHKYGPAKAVICVSPARMVKDGTVSEGTEPWPVAVDENGGDREDWEDVVVREVAEEEDDWVKV